MTTYKRHSLGELIEALRGLPDGAEVNGLTRDIFSYRGYYERNSISPNWDTTVLADSLADSYTEQIGKPIHGYKGGDYEVSTDQLVYLASYGDTGPSIIGLSQDAVSGIYEPVLLADDYHY